MADETARLAVLLARSVGRFDWWNFYWEHTDYEWACQVAAYQVEPHGERRADIRAAYHTANLIAAQSVNAIGDEDFREMFKNLSTYLKCDEVPEKKITPEQTARQVEKAFERLG